MSHRKKSVGKERRKKGLMVFHWISPLLFLFIFFVCTLPVGRLSNLHQRLAFEKGETIRKYHDGKEKEGKMEGNIF